MKAERATSRPRPGVIEVLVTPDQRRMLWRWCKRLNRSYGLQRRFTPATLLEAFASSNDSLGTWAINCDPRTPAEIRRARRARAPYRRALDQKIRERRRRNDAKRRAKLAAYNRLARQAERQGSLSKEDAFKMVDALADSVLITLGVPAKRITQGKVGK